MFLLVNRNVLFVVAVILIMSEDQFRSMLIVTPSYLAASVVLS